METNYVIAPPNWSYESPNPFSSDGLYGQGWSCFVLLNADNDRFFHGMASNELFGFHAGRRCEHLKERAADFLRYEFLWGRKVIVCGPSDFSIGTFLQRALAETPSGSVVRPHDPRWIAHSTTISRWEAIRSCGELHSLASLRRAGVDIRGIGREELGEPADYAEHVALGSWDAIAGEYVVASHNAGRIVTEEHLPYEPGMRLYFDAHRIIRDGLAVRDGLHLLKVRDCLRLDPYLVTAIGIADIDPKGEVKTWTPRSFFGRATNHFRDSKNLINHKERIDHIAKQETQR